MNPSSALRASGDPAPRGVRPGDGAPTGGRGQVSCRTGTAGGVPSGRPSQGESPTRPYGTATAGGVPSGRPSEGESRTRPYRTTTAWAGGKPPSPRLRRPRQACPTEGGVRDEQWQRPPRKGGEVGGGWGVPVCRRGGGPTPLLWQERGRRPPVRLRSLRLRSGQAVTPPPGGVAPRTGLPRVAGAKCPAELERPAGSLLDDTLRASHRLAPTERRRPAGFLLDDPPRASHRLAPTGQQRPQVGNLRHARPTKRAYSGGPVREWQGPAGSLLDDPPRASHRLAPTERRRPAGFLLDDPARASHRLAPTEQQRPQVGDPPEAGKPS
jgi:hypothetical protein